MTPKDRSTIERALGTIEGVAYGAPEHYKKLLLAAVEMIERVLAKEAVE